MKYKNIRKEELKNKVGADWFEGFDTTEIVGNIDFTVFPEQDGLFGRTALLWAEAKTGDFDIPSMFVQLILTIGKARTFDKTLPPAFLGAFDGKKIVFVPYSDVQDIFYLNDFNWTVAPSNHDTKEFELIQTRIEQTLAQNTHVYEYEKDEAELRFFIKNNVAQAIQTSKIQIDKNNFIPIYLRWLDAIKPIIDVNWDDLKKVSIIDSDFYLADLFVDDKGTDDIADDTTIRKNLFVFFQNQAYVIPKKYLNQIFDAGIPILDKAVYQQFWKRYKRPPISAFHDYIIERRDLLVPQDIRERKGAFFTPRQWVELSQKYLADVLGADWQDEYYIWDCAAGTGNLLAGLTNKLNIWASTLDQADVNVMHERIERGANLLQSHTFQFDFLNDDFSKLPKGLQHIINDENKRKKLVIYINPPYAEATNARTATGTGQNKAGVAKDNKVREVYRSKINGGSNEIFALFMCIIYDKMPEAKLAQFSTLKFVQGANFKKFRDYFSASFEKGFIVKANSFDNVVGDFPIGFTIWDLQKKEKIKTVACDIINDAAQSIGKKNFYGQLNESINNWLTLFYSTNNLASIGVLSTRGNDFQNQKYIYLATQIDNKTHDTKVKVNTNNLIPITIYLSVRHCISATWLNDRDQFLFPNDNWKTDKKFQNDCLTYALFHGQNKVIATDGINNWIPFTEQDVNAKEKFGSNFMTDFIKGKIKPNESVNLFKVKEDKTHYETPLKFSAEATAVFDAGRRLWTHYHSQKFLLTESSADARSEYNENASLYDIRAHFQGRNDNGRMNAKSTDEKYTELIGDLRQELNLLADKIAPKVYEYGFLMR